MLEKPKREQSLGEKPLKGKISRSHIHDMYFKERFSDPKQAKELLLFALKAWERDLFRWETLKEEKDSFNEGSKADLVFSVHLKASRDKSPVMIRIALEHKSWKDKLSFPQMLRYQNRLAERLFEETGSMPWVLNVLIYHGKAFWLASSGFEERRFEGKKTENEKTDLFLDQIALRFCVRFLDIRRNAEIGNYLAGKRAEAEDEAESESKARSSLFVLSNISGLDKRELLDPGPKGFFEKLWSYIKNWPIKERRLFTEETVTYTAKSLGLKEDQIKETLKHNPNYRRDNMSAILELKTAGDS